MVISIDLKPILSTTVTYLTSPISASATALTVINNGGFATNDYILIGGLATEQAELASISGTTSNTGITSSSTKFPHSSNTSITKVFYNQIKVEKSTDGGSNWSVESTININGDQEYYDYSVNGALSTDIYRTRFYNSTTAVYSPYSNEIAASGSVVETIINSVFSKLKIDEKGDEQIKPEDVFNLIAETDLEITREIVRLNPNYFNTTYNISFVEDTQEYLLPTNFARAYRVLVKWDTNDDLKESNLVDEDFSESLTDVALRRTHYIKFSSGRYYIGFHAPITEALSNAVKVYYIIRPQRIYETSQDLNLPQDSLFTDVLEARVLQKIFMYYKVDMGLADRQELIYQNGLQSIRQIIGMSDWSDEAYRNSMEVEQIFNPYGNY